MTTWRKSSASNNGRCVELADLGSDVVGVRDSKLGDTSPVLQLTRGQVADLLSRVKAGDLDHMG
jgi:hypothetical protein